MGTIIKGDVVVIPFPFSDLSEVKRRPALVLASFPGDDILLCQITSQHTRDNFAIALTTADFASGSLPVNSFIRPSRIFTADKNIIIRRVGTVNPQIMNEVIRKIIYILE